MTLGLVFFLMFHCLTFVLDDVDELFSYLLSYFFDLLRIIAKFFYIVALNTYLTVMELLLVLITCRILVQMFTSLVFKNILGPGFPQFRLSMLHILLQSFVPLFSLTLFICLCLLIRIRSNLNSFLFLLFLLDIILSFPIFVAFLHTCEL